MARKDLLPSYLSQPPWRDLCDAIDSIFQFQIDEPTNNLGKLRRPWLLNASANDKVANAQLLSISDLDVFESEVQIKQINASGLIFQDPDQFDSNVKARFFRLLPRFWYSKGTYSVVDFLSFVLNTEMKLTRMWTQDYVTFLPEGDPGIGSLLYAGGTWYPTTHTEVELGLATLPLGFTLPVFARMFESICNYPLVPQYVISDRIWIATAGQNILTEVALCGFTVEHEVLCNFAITGAETSSGSGEGGFEAITSIKIPGSGGTGYTTPPAPSANFTADVTSGVHPLIVTFTNTSTGPRNGSAWDFNSDGVVDSTKDSVVSFTYTSAGVYSVSLNVFNSSGFSNKKSTGYITVS